LDFKTGIDKKVRPRMSREPTPEELRALCKRLMEDGAGIKRIVPADMVNASTVALIVDDDGEDRLFRTFDKMSVTEGMGS
jgi:hypothetical protein